MRLWPPPNFVGKVIYQQLAHFQRCPPLGRLKSVKNVLPKPPVPELKATLDRFRSDLQNNKTSISFRYLEYAAVVALGQKASLAPTHDAGARFLKEAAPLQSQLLRVAEDSPNWVTKYWLSEMYMRVRLPTPVNSNPGYIFPRANFKNTEDHLRYTALLTRGLLEYKNKIDVFAAVRKLHYWGNYCRNQIEKEVSTGAQKIHMCMEQYERIMNCYRQPGITEDRQFRKPKTHEENEHVLVLCRKQTFVMHTRCNGTMLPMADILHQLRKIEEASKTNELASVGIGACGAGFREDGARLWEELFTVEQNVASFQWVKDALFVVCVDVDDGDGVGRTRDVEQDFVQRGVHMLTGHGSRRHGLNRWYDATIQLVVGSDGSNGLCIEHSTAEGIVIINMAEFAISYAQKYFNSNLMSESQRSVHPKTLTWHVSNNAKAILKQLTGAFDELAAELELQVLVFDAFGKEAIKKWRVSPDGFVQLAMQLAHYKTHGYLVSTYESASIRRFGAGRVDNIRANTQEALEWVTAMEATGVSRLRRLELFHRAIAKQAKVTAENISGYGIDNHLCALFVLAREREEATGEDMPALFLDPLWGELMRFPLSTSQVTTSTALPDSYLCYGAVARDGYGCSYCIHPDRVLFAPSAFRSNPRTDLAVFKRNLREAMLQMHELVEA